MLVLAFAAAAGGGGGYRIATYHNAEDAKANSPVVMQYKQQQEHMAKMMPMTQAERDAYTGGRNAAIWQIATLVQQKRLDQHIITQDVFDKSLKEDGTVIAAKRAPFLGKPELAVFDKTLQDELKSNGWTTMPDLDQIQKDYGTAPGATPEAATAPQPQTARASAFPVIAGIIAEALAQEMAANQSTVIGPTATDPALWGTTEHAQIFPGGPQQNSTRVPASIFQQGQRYSFDGKLTIDGNLPAHVTLNITNGKLVLNGNAGEGDRINVVQPTVTVGGDPASPAGTHKEKYDCWNNATGPSIDKPSDYTYHYGYRHDACEKDVPNAQGNAGSGHEELKYKDTEPAAHITGSVGLDVKVSTNGGKVRVDNKSNAAAPAKQAGTAGPVPAPRQG